MFTSRKALATAAIAALAVLPLAACSDNSSSGSSSSSSSASAASSAPAAATTPELVADVPTLTGVATSVALDKGFTDALTTLGLTPGVVGSATLKDGSINFPITGGNVKYFKPGTTLPFVQGIIHHEGSGLSLTAGATKVELTNFTIDPGTSKLMGDVTVNGTLAAPQAVLFDLDGRTLKPLQTNPDGTATLTGTKVDLNADAAALLNKTFNTDALKPLFLIGVSTITINTK